MNDRFPSHLLPANIYQLLQNVVTDQSRIAKRQGTVAQGASLGAFAILGLSAYEPISGTKYIIACRNGTSNSQLYKYTGTGNFVAIGSANLTLLAPMNFVQAGNVLYGFNGTDAVSVDSALTVTKNPATVPLGKVAEWFHNYLFVANVSGFPNRIYWSDLGNPTNFTVATNFVDINANDGDQITGLVVFNDELYVFKNKTIWAITGFSGSTFSASTASGQNVNSKIFGYGTPSQQSIVVTGKDMYYLSFLGGIPHFRSFKQTTFSTTLESGIVSWDIENTMAGLNVSQLSLCAGIYDGKYIRWAVPNGGSANNNLVLVFEPNKIMKSKLAIMRSWVKWTGITPSQYTVSSISGSNQIYFGDATTGGFVFKENSGDYTDNGTPVSMDVRSRDYMFDISKKHKAKYLYLRYKSGLAGTLAVNAREDQASTFTNQENLSLGGNSPGLGPTGTFTLGVSTLGGSTVTTHRTTFQHLTGHMLGIQYTEATSSYCEIYDQQIYGYIKGLRNS